MNNMDKRPDKQTVAKVGKFVAGFVVGVLGNKGTKTVVEIIKTKEQAKQYKENLVETRRHNDILENQAKAHKDLQNENHELKKK